MSTTKFKFSTFVSPVGIAHYAWLDKPDNGFGGKEDPKYKIRTLIPDTDENRAWAQEVINTLLAEAKQAGVKIKKVYKSPFVFPEDIEEDDFLPADGKDKPKFGPEYRDHFFFEAKSDYKSGLLDAELNPLSDKVRIMTGDSVCTKVQGFPYEGLGSGISFHLKVVQLVQKNANFGGVDTGGFEQHAGGFVAPKSGAGDQKDDEF